MATEKPNGNGREQFEGTFGGQRFAVSVRDLLSILLLAGTFLLGWIVWSQMSLGLRLLHGQHRQIETMIDQQNTLLRAQARELANLLFTLDYNIGKPLEQRIPLRFSLDAPPRAPGPTPQQREDRVREDIDRADTHP